MTSPEQGTLIDLDGSPALRFERRYSHPMERVWRAISDASEMASWFPSNVEGDRAVGAELSFGSGDGPTFRGRVIAYDPPKVFSFTWGSEVLRFELLPEGDTTLLVFTQILSHQSVAARNGSGWHACLGNLDALLGGDAPASDSWQEVYEDYLTRMGPSLGTPTGNGAMQWERATHVDADRVRDVIDDPAAWGGADHANEPLHWDVESTDAGTIFRLTHDAIGDDAALAATWHALLVQLDMHLASGRLIPVEPKLWIDAYAERLG